MFYTLNFTLFLLPFLFLSFSFLLFFFYSFSFTLSFLPFNCLILPFFLSCRLKSVSYTFFLTLFSVTTGDRTDPGFSLAPWPPSGLGPDPAIEPLYLWLFLYTVEVASIFHYWRIQPPRIFETSTIAPVPVSMIRNETNHRTKISHHKVHTYPVPAPSSL